jgi:hypothetical protein
MNARVGLAALALLVAASASAQPSIRVCENRNMGGRCETFRHGVDDLREWGFANRISSFRIEEGTWLLCTDYGFRGICEEYRRSEMDLNGTRLQDNISSLRPVRGMGGGGGGGRASIAVYSQPGYRGKSWVFSDDIADLGRVGLNNQVSSIRIYGGRWQICEQQGFRGCRSITNDIPDLNYIGWNNRVSSIREGGGWNDDWGGGRGSGGGSGWGGSGGSGGGGWGGSGGSGGRGGGRGTLTLFEHANYGGMTFEVKDEVADLGPVGFNDRASSIQITGGRWQVCTDSYFKGQCRTISGDVRDMDRGFNDKISSVRRF